MHETASAAEMGHASSAVLVSLLRTLVDKDILTSVEVRALLSRAATDLGPFEHIAPAKGAVGFILNDLLPQFAEEGGD